MCIRDREKALAFLNGIRAKHRTANHNVYAYILRDGARMRYSDDGEPAKTSGPVSYTHLDVYKRQVLDRANSMLQRDKNHASVLIWSCGNESFGGRDIYEMSRFFRETDPTRLVHYEGVFHDRAHYDNIKQMVKAKAGRAMQKKERERKTKSGKIIKVAGCSPIRAVSYTHLYVRQPT